MQNTIINNKSIDNELVKNLIIKVVNFLLSIAEDIDDDTLIESVKKKCLYILGEDNVELNEFEEERRLCYVGITRAEQQVYFTYTQKRLYFGAKTEGYISRFILDIPEELLIPIKY